VDFCRTRRSAPPGLEQRLLLRHLLLVVEVEEALELAEALVVSLITRWG
jgi:hypothetical protein